METFAAEDSNLLFRISVFFAFDMRKEFGLFLLCKLVAAIKLKSYTYGASTRIVSKLFILGRVILGSRLFDATSFLSMHIG